MNLPIATRLVAVVAFGTLCTAGLARAGEPASPRVVAYASMNSQAEVARPAAGGAGQASSAACAAQAWPHVDPACLTAADGTPARRAVRTIGLAR